MRIPVGQEVRPMSSPAPLDTAGRALAVWQTTRPWLWAVVVAFGGALLSAFGVGFSQVRHLDQVPGTYAQATFIAISALVGLAVMWRTKPSLGDYGFRSPLHLDRALWLLPLFAVPLILLAFTKVA